MNAAAMAVTLLAWKPLRKNSLLGFASIELRGSLIIDDVTVHESNGKRWASLPSKPMLSGLTVKTDAAGKPVYIPVLKWKDRDTSDRFSMGVIAAIEAEHPQDLQG